MDPYCIVRLGAAQSVTQVVRRDHNPIWVHWAQVSASRQWVAFQYYTFTLLYGYRINMYLIMLATCPATEESLYLQH